MGDYGCGVGGEFMIPCSGFELREGAGDANELISSVPTNPTPRGNSTGSSRALWRALWACWAWPTILGASGCSRTNIPRSEVGSAESPAVSRDAWDGVIRTRWSARLRLYCSASRMDLRVYVYWLLTRVSLVCETAQLSAPFA